MLNDKVSFPYPILRSRAEDYNSSVFKDELSVVIDEGKYEVIPHFEINNPELLEMIEQKKLSYALHISCPSTYLRRIEMLDKPDKVIPFDPGEVHYKVDLQPFIIATEDIQDFSNEDFSNEYSDMKFSLQAGDAVGVGEVYSFSATYRDDVIHDASSVIKVEGSDTAKFMGVDPESSYLKVVLPSEQCNSYKNCKGQKEKYDLLNATIIIPALVQAIDIIKQNRGTGEEITEYPWFVTIETLIEKIAEELKVSIVDLLENPVTTAQRIMENNSKTVIAKIENM